MEYLLALDIAENYVSGVLLEVGQKVTVVRSYGVASLAGSSLGGGIGEVIRQTGFSSGECRVAISTARCSFRNLSLPFREERKIVKVLEFELEELTSFVMAEKLVDYFLQPFEGTETQILAAMVDRSVIEDLLEQLQEAGVDPNIVSVSGVATALALTAASDNSKFLLLDIGLRQTTLVVIENGRPVLVRPLAIDTISLAGYSVSESDGKLICKQPEGIHAIIDRLIPLLRQTLISAGFAELLEKRGTCFINGVVGLDTAMLEQLRHRLTMDVTPCNISKRPLLKIEPVDGQQWIPAIFNTPLALALWQRKDGPLFNFRSGDFRKRRSFKEFKKKVMMAAVGLAVIFVGTGLYLARDYGQLATKHDALDTEIRSVFQQALPDVTRVVDPLQQLKVRVAEGRRVSGKSQGAGSVSKLRILAELSARIPESMQVRITRLVSDQDELRIVAETSDFNTVDNVKRELEKSSLFGQVVISSANLAPKGGGVRFELRVQFR